MIRTPNLFSDENAAHSPALSIEFNQFEDAQSSDSLVLLKPEYFTNVINISSPPSSKVTGGLKSEEIGSSDDLTRLSSRIMAKFPLQSPRTSPARSPEQVPEAVKKKKKKKKKSVSIEPLSSQAVTPIGVFWDIENCQVPRFKSALAVVETIRKKLLAHYREADFVVVCDIQKEREDVIRDLNNAQVTVVHVACTSKNAADEKLRQCMRRYTDNVGLPCAVMLISSDVNFAVDLSDFKNRKKIHVILVHGPLASEALLLCSSQQSLYDDLIDDIPFSTPKQQYQHVGRVMLNVSNLPRNVPLPQVRQRVEQIMENCGGRLVQYQAGGNGVIKFPTPESAQRALLRMEGEDVFGCKISLQYSTRPVHEKEMIGAAKRRYTPFPPPPNPALVAPPRLIDFSSHRHLGLDQDDELRDRQDPIMLDLHNTTDLPDSRGVDDTFRRAVVDADGPNRWDYYRTPSEYLVEKTPQGHRRIRGAHKGGKSGNEGDNNGNKSRNGSLEDRAAYIPFSAADHMKLMDYKPVCSSTSYSTSSNSSPSPSLPAPNGTASSVDLHVTNLDQSIGAKEMKNLLTTVFKQHVMVLNVTVHLQSDGHLAAIVRVPSVQDAQYCVSQLHRRKLGNKRIMIAYDHNGSSSGSGRNTPTPLQIRAQVNTLLSEIPQRRLPLFKFRELYEQRFHTSVSLADLHRLRDILYVTDDAHGRCVVFLQQGGQGAIQPMLSSQAIPFSKASHREMSLGSSTSSSGRCVSSGEPELSISEMPRCPIHDAVSHSGSHGWAEPEPLPELPLVNSTLHQLSLHVHALLQSHGGSVPLASVPRCFEMEIGTLNVSEDKGVPLEHLISCVKGVGIVSVAGHKRLQWAGKNEQAQDTEPLQSLNPSLLPQMSLLCRELVDLLKMAPQCRIPFSKFIPAYHHHFGRQCRVADYGYTRLIDLLEALSHVVQILGEGNRRYVTLSHRAQVKRFTSDLLRILKAQASKQISVSLFPALYEKTLSRVFDARDYGLCELSDLLGQVAEASVVVMAAADGEELIALPKREQTFEEMERTKQFAVEVVELLKHAPQCKLDFAKFIPAYHHHFGRQCRVADYGCTKLVELFETIPDTVQVFEMDNEIEKYVQLTTKQRLRILSEQVATLVRNQPGRSLILNSLPDAFRLHFGFALRPEQYEACDLDDLVSKLRNNVQVIYTDRGAELSLIDQNALSQAKSRVIRLLYPTPDGLLSLRKLLELYKHNYGQECSLTFLTDHMEDVVQVDNESHSEPVVRFVSLRLFSRQIHVLLNENGGRLLLANFETSFQERFGEAVRPSQYGHSNVTSLLQSISHSITLRGKGPRRVLMVARDISDLTPPHMARAPKRTMGIKPPAHWLLPPPTKLRDEPEEELVVARDSTVEKPDMYEDLKQLFFNSSSNSSSTLMYAPMPAFVPSVPWAPMWSVGMGMMTMSSSGSPAASSSASNSPSYPPQGIWNLGSPASLPNYPCNYWVTAWPAPCAFSVPMSPVANYSGGTADGSATSRVSVQEIEDSPSNCGTSPPPASVLPRPSAMLSTAVTCAADGEETIRNPIKSRIAAQFRNPVEPT